MLPHLSPLSGMIVLDLTQIMAGPIYNMAQVYGDPQVQAREMLVDLEDPQLGVLHNIGIPVKLSATPGRIRRRAPALGEHSREILREASFSEEDIEELVSKGWLPLIRTHDSRDYVKQG